MFVRLSLGNPTPENRTRVAALEEEVLAFFAGRPGFVDGYVLTSLSQVGRLTVWESEQAAEQAGTADRSMALRSQISIALPTFTLEIACDATRVAAK